MPQITLTEEQEKVIAAAAEPTLIRNALGSVVGVIAPPWGVDDIQEAKRRLASAEPRHTTAEVLARLGASELP